MDSIALPMWAWGVIAVVALAIVAGEAAWRTAVYSQLTAIRRELRSNAKEHRDIWERINSHSKLHAGHGERIANHDARIVALEGR